MLFLFFDIRSGEYGPQSIFLESLQKKLLLYIEETKKYVQTLKIRGFWIVLEKIQKNKKKTCIIASDWIY